MAFSLVQSARFTPVPAQDSLLTRPATAVRWHLWALWLVGFGLFSMMIPRDASFDVVHYHLHNGWAALNQRDGHDLAPAELHTFLNPAWQVFTWLLVDNLPGRVAAFILGVGQGLILPALYALTRRLLAAAGAQPSLTTVMTIAVAGFLAEAQFGLFGSVRNDAICALVFIASLTLLLPRTARAPGLGSLALASFMMGALMGMKLTNAVYVAGFAVAAMLALPGWGARVRGALVCALAGLLGLALLGGPWAWHMNQTFGNPLFPMMNGFFDAPLGPDSAFRDARFLPDRLIDALFRPFAVLRDGNLVNEGDFFDLRFVFSYLGALCILGALALFPRRLAAPQPRALLAISAGLLVAIFVWTGLFSIARYMSAAWILGPSLLATLIALVRPAILHHPRTPIATLACAAALFVATEPAELRRVPWLGWSERYVGVTLPDRDYSSSLVVFAGDYPAAFLAPEFPPSTRLTHAVPQLWSAPALDNYRPLIADLMASNADNLHVVIVETGTNFGDTLARLSTAENIEVITLGCEPIATTFSSAEVSWQICPARLRR